MKYQIFTFVPTEFTNTDFWNICDNISLLPEDRFIRVIVKGEQIEFDWIFNYKDDAKKNINKIVGKNIFNISIKAIAV